MDELIKKQLGEINKEIEASEEALKKLSFKVKKLKAVKSKLEKVLND